MRRLNVIGIGVGDPEYITVQAIKALDRTVVFFVTDKGDEKAICCTEKRDLRTLRGQFSRPDRGDARPRDDGRILYGHAVRQWREKRVVLREGPSRQSWQVGRLEAS